MMGPWLQQTIWVRHDDRGVVVRLTTENPYDVVGVEDDGPSHPDHADCVWDANRIESTKTVLFQEAIADRRI